MEALASHGFVVAAPDHAGNTALDAIAGTSDAIGVAAINRPRDVSFVIDQMPLTFTWCRSSPTS